MIGGFALIATPADYGVTGVQTFIIITTASCIRRIRPDSVALAKAITRYNPDKTWVRTKDAWAK